MNFSLPTWLVPFLGWNSVNECCSQALSLIRLQSLDLLEPSCWVRVPLFIPCVVFHVEPVRGVDPPVLLIQLELETATTTIRIHAECKIFI